MLALAIGAGASPLLRNARPWWSSPGRLLDGQTASILADMPSGGFRSGSSTVSIGDLLSVSSGTKRVIGQTGTLDTIAANSPAWDWSTGRRRLMVEARSATKYGPCSEAVVQNWTRTGVTLGTAALGPDATAGLSEMIEDGTNGPHRVVPPSSGNLPIVAGGFVAFRGLFRRGNGGRNVHLDLSGTGVGIRLDLATGTTFVSAGTAGRITTTPAYGGGWWLEVTATATLTGEFLPAVSMADAIWSTTYAGDGSSSIRIGYFNAEKASTPNEPPSSHVSVPATAAVTRLSDDVRFSPSALAVMVQSTVATLVVRGSLITPPGPNRVIFGAANADNTDRLCVYGGASNAKTILAGHAGSSLAPTVLSDTDQNFGLAVAVTASGVKGALDGGAVSSSAGTPPTLSTLTMLRFGNRYEKDMPANLCLDEIALWPFAGSNAGLSAQAHVWS